MVCVMDVFVNEFGQIWYHNVPHTLLAKVKGHQNWVKVSGEFLTFPGGGTQFIHGALHYIDFLQEVTIHNYIFIKSKYTFGSISFAHVSI